MTKAILPALLLALLAGPVRADEKKAEPPKKVKFSTLKTQHMVVEAKVNGKGPYRLIFDTGAPLMLVNNRLAKDAGIIDKDTKKPAFAPFGMVGQPVKMKSFELGELKLENVNTMVMDHPTVTAISNMFGPIDGIVGFPFFAQFRTTVDYQKKELTFVPSGYQPSDIMQSLQAKLMSGAGTAGPTVVAPAAQWGFRADKDSQDADAGLVVREVLADSAAAKAGLKPGDRLLTLDGRWTDTVVDLFEAASHVKPGRTVPLKVKRGGQEIELTATPTAGL